MYTRKKIPCSGLFNRMWWKFCQQIWTWPVMQTLGYEASAPKGGKFFTWLTWLGIHSLFDLMSLWLFKLGPLFAYEGNIVVDISHNALSLYSRKQWLRLLSSCHQVNNQIDCSLSVVVSFVLNQFFFQY